MQALWFYAIVAVLAVLLFNFYPYLLALFAVWLLQKRTFRCFPAIETVLPDAMPEHLSHIFQTVITQLEPLGFQVSSYHLIEKSMTEEEGNDWGILLHNAAQFTFATLKIGEPLKPNTPVSLMFYTFFEGDFVLATVNSKYYKFYSENPNETAQFLGKEVDVATQWQAHYQKTADLSESKSPCILTSETFINALEKHLRMGMERLVQKGEVRWVQPGESYRINWWIALSPTIKMSMEMKQAQQNPPQPVATAIDPITVEATLDLEVEAFQRWQQQQQRSFFSKQAKSWLLLGTLALFIASYSSLFPAGKMVIFVAVLLFHEGGHVLAMKLFGYRDTTMLFVPFLGALATARKENASLTEKVWVSLAGPLPGLLLGIGIAIIFSPSEPSTLFSNWSPDYQWLREVSLMLIVLNLFNLLPIYPLDGGQIADLLVFSRNPYVGVVFKGVGVLLLGLLGFVQPVMFLFAVLIALTIPTSFRLAKLNVALRKELRRSPPTDQQSLIRLLFSKLHHPPYQSMPFAQKQAIVSGLLATYHEHTAKWPTRTGLSVLYLASLCFGFIGGLYALSPDSDSRTSLTSSLLMEGREASARRYYKQQIERTTQVLQANPKDVEAYLRRGSVRISLKDYPNALLDANQVLKLDPNSLGGYSLRGSVRRYMGDLKGAKADGAKMRNLMLVQEISNYDREIRLYPKNIANYMQRAQARTEFGDYKGAIADCNLALQLNRRRAGAWLLRGNVYLQLKNYRQAIVDANQAMQIKPDFADAYYLRSRAYAQLGDRNKATADAAKADQLYDSQDEDHYGDNFE